MAGSGLTNRWTDAWPDAVAFTLGLGAAWLQDWSTTDLVWSLWLASFVVGYTLILSTFVVPGFDAVRSAWNDRAMLAAEGLRAVFGAGVLLTAVAFFVGFYTLHFGGFHFVHSVFLQTFFPLDGKASTGFPDMALYGQVVHRYWWFLPAAFVAERAAFRRPPPNAPPDVAVTAEAIARRKARALDTPLMAPYKNVIRMHLLIFFFAGAHFLQLDNFAVYAVVYTAYFFPWRLLRGSAVYGRRGLTDL